MPFSGPQPQDSEPPPPPNWGAAPASDEQGASAAKTGTGYGATKSNKNRQAAMRGGETMRSEAKKLSEAELAHLAWISRGDDDEDDYMGRKNSKRAGQVKDVTAGEIELLPATRWMIIHGGDFASIAKDLPSFRHIFTKSIATSIGIPSGCMEVVNIGRGAQGSGIIVHFILKPAKRGGDTRDGEELMERVDEQMASSFSALRKGHFGSFAESATLVMEDPLRPATPGRPPTADGTREPTTMTEALAQLEAAKARIVELEATHLAALEEMQKRDGRIAELEAEVQAAAAGHT